MSDQPTGSQASPLPFPSVPAGRTRADLDQFWIDWEPVIRRVARAKLRIAGVPRGLADADDAVQHIYLQLHVCWPLPEFATADPGRAALGAILADFVRAQIDELKNRRNRPGNRHADQDESALEQATPEPGPDDLLIQQEVDRFLREALGRLPELQRQAVEMTVAGKLSRDEIADRMGVRAGTVSSHRVRGLRKLAEALGPIITMIIQGIGWAANGGVAVLLVALALLLLIV